MKQHIQCIVLLITLAPSIAHSASTVHSTSDSGTYLSAYLKKVQTKISEWQTTIKQSPINNTTMQTIKTEINSTIDTLIQMIHPTSLADMPLEMHQKIFSYLTEPLIDYIKDYRIDMVIGIKDIKIRAVDKEMYSLSKEYLYRKIYNRDSLSSDEIHIVMFEEDAAYIQNIIDNKATAVKFEYTKNINGALFTPDQQHIIIISYDDAQNNLEIITWNFKNNTHTSKFCKMANINMKSLQFNNEKTQIFFTTNNTAYIWDIAAEKMLNTYTDNNRILTAQWNPYIQKIVISTETENSNQSLKLWDTKTQKHIQLSGIQSIDNKIYNNKLITFNADGTFLCIAINSTLYLWNSNTDKFIKKSITELENIHKIMFNPTNKNEIIILHQEGPSNIASTWDFQTQKITQIFNKNPHPSIHDIIFTPDKKTAVIQTNNSFLLWNIESSECIQNIHNNLGLERIQQTLLSPNTTCIALVLENKIKIYHKASSKQFIEWLKSDAATPKQILYIANKIGLTFKDQLSQKLTKAEELLLFNNKKNTGFEQTMPPGALHFLTNVLEVTKPTRPRGGY